MYGNGWFDNGFCPIGFGGGNFGLWYFLIFTGILIVAVAIMLNRKTKKSSGIDAVETLKMLYVKGEISEEEYLKRKNVIERK